VQDPESAYAYTSHCVALGFAGRAEQALPSGHRAVELDPDSLYAHWSLLIALGELGRCDEELELARRAMERFGRHPWLLLTIAIAAGKAGRRELAAAVYAELKGRAVFDYVQRCILATVAGHAGQLAEGFALLREAIREREPMLVAAIWGWPGLAMFRDRPEFPALLREMGWEYRGPGVGGTRLTQGGAAGATAP
jgi:tetratricopeptide (TPR) repeat protein